MKIAGAAAIICATCVAATTYASRLQTSPPGPQATPTSVALAQIAPAVSGTALRSNFGHPSVVLAADPRGHYLAEPQINGAKVRTLVDTGASVVALSAEDARRAGLFPAGADYRIPVNTANGMVKAAPVILREVRLGEIVVRDVEAMVLPEGRLQGTLLGMSFLRRLGMESAQGRLVLTQ